MKFLYLDSTSCMRVQSCPYASKESNVHHCNLECKPSKEVLASQLYLLQLTFNQLMRTGQKVPEELIGSFYKIQMELSQCSPRKSQ